MMLNRKPMLNQMRNTIYYIKIIWNIISNFNTKCLFWYEVLNPVIHPSSNIM